MPRQSSSPIHRICGPAELLQAVPYLLGFHPARSLVLVGLATGELVVTARLDLADATTPGVLAQTLDAMHRGGSTHLVAAVYDDDAAPDPSGCAALPWAQLVGELDLAADRLECGVFDVLLVSSGRWWSYGCGQVECCPPVGRALPDAPTAFTAAAAYSGVVALPDRSALEAQLDPLPDDVRAGLGTLISDAENASVRAVLEGRSDQHLRSAKRAIFAAARASDEVRWAPPADADAARFGVALAEIAIRDAVWMAIDDGRLDGRALWRDLGRRLPAPYNAAALFLYGWDSWRAGDGALAGIAAQRAVDSDPQYSAADLLLAALTRGIDPRRMPKLRLPRSA